MQILPALALLVLPFTAHAQDAFPKNHGNEALAVPPAAPAGPPASAPALAANAESAALMDRIESIVALPGGARPIDGYARYYAWADRDRTKVTAVYVAGAAGRGWVPFDELPDVALLQGGCAAVALVYDVPGHRIDEIGCGIAG